MNKINEQRLREIATATSGWPVEASVACAELLAAREKIGRLEQVCDSYQKDLAGRCEMHLKDCAELRAELDKVRAENERLTRKCVTANAQRASTNLWIQECHEMAGRAGAPRGVNPITWALGQLDAARAELRSTQRVILAASDLVASHPASAMEMQTLLLRLKKELRALNDKGQGPVV